MVATTDSGLLMVNAVEKRQEDKKKKKGIMIDPAATLRAKNQSFKKRKETIMKKSYELSECCAADVCTIVFDADGKVETWPQNKDDLMRIINKYRECTLNKKKANHDGCKKNKEIVDCTGAEEQGSSSEVADNNNQLILHAEQQGMEVDTASWIEELLLASEPTSGKEELFLVETTNDHNCDQDHDLPSAVINEEAKGETGIVKEDQIQMMMMQIPSFDDDHEQDNVDEWLNQVINWDSFETGHIKEDQTMMQVNCPPSFDDHEQAEQQDMNMDLWLNQVINWDSFEEDVPVPVQAAMLCSESIGSCIITV